MDMNSALSATTRHLCSLPEDCLNTILNNFTNPHDFAHLSQTCTQFAPLFGDERLWSLFCTHYLPQGTCHSDEVHSAISFQTHLKTRVQNLSLYLQSLDLQEIEPILEEIEADQSDLKKLIAITRHSNAIFTAICSVFPENTIIDNEFRDYTCRHSSQRTCGARFMGYFKNELPLPSKETLSPYLKQILNVGPMGACLYAYFKNDQATILSEAIEMSDLTNASQTYLVSIHHKILSYAKGSVWSDLFKQGFDPNFEKNKNPFLCHFVLEVLRPIVKSPAYQTTLLQIHQLSHEIEHTIQTQQREDAEELQACKNQLDSFLNLSFTMRSYSLPPLRFHLAQFSTEYYLRLKEYIGDDACPKLGIEGDHFLYGLEQNNDQLLKDFETLCSLPGINLLVTNEKGQTALEIAESLEMYDVAEILKTAIAKQNLSSQ